MGYGNRLQHTWSGGGARTRDGQGPLSMKIVDARNPLSLWVFLAAPVLKIVGHFGETATSDQPAFGQSQYQGSFR